MELQTPFFAILSYSPYRPLSHALCMVTRVSSGPPHAPKTTFTIVSQAPVRYFHNSRQCFVQAFRAYLSGQLTVNLEKMYLGSKGLYQPKIRQNKWAFSFLTFYVCFIVSCFFHGFQLFQKG